MSEVSSDDTTATAAKAPGIDELEQLRVRFTPFFFSLIKSTFVLVL